MSTSKVRSRFPFLLLGAVLTLTLTAGLARAETAYFVMTGPFHFSAPDPTDAESYVVAVSDPALIHQARTFLNSVRGVTYLVPHVKVTLGADGTNRNYSEPGNPPWAWHATELIEWVVYDPTLIRPTVYLPQLHAMPSTVVKEVLSHNVLGGPFDRMTLVHFPLVAELKSPTASNLVNLASRGWVGTGDRVLIAGFVIEGGAPRNILVRAIGPSLSAFGVAEALADPTLTVYRGPQKIAENDDWGTGNFRSPPILQTTAPAPPPWYDHLFPLNPKESALRLTLPPGAYTAQVRGVNGTGVALVEIYDFDAMAPR